MSQAIAGDTNSYGMIENPIFIVSSPRSGSTLLFETLAKSPDLFTVGGESHRIIEGVPALAMPARSWTSNRLTEVDATPEIVTALTRSFQAELVDRDGRPPAGKVRMLEKTPKNALRVPFLDAIWPEASFIFLYRDPRQTMASMIEAWLSGKFRTYPRLPGWNAWPWSLLLVPGWEELKGLPLPQIVARQWAITMNILLDDLERLPADRVAAISLDQFISSPQQAVDDLAIRLNFTFEEPLGDELPKSQTTVSDPAPDKWRGIENVIEKLWPIVRNADVRAQRLLGQHSKQTGAMP